MPLITLTTGPSAVLNGSVSIPLTLMDPIANRIKVVVDVSNHLDGNPANITFSFDVSLDGGVTWMTGASATRVGGSSLLSQCFISCGIISDGAGDLQRMVRGTLTTTAPVVTSMQIVPAAAAVP